MSCVWYVSASWELVRELYWFAIESSAMELLAKAAYRAAHLCQLPFSPVHLRNTFFIKGGFKKVLAPYTKANAWLNMSACLQRAHRIFTPHLIKGGHMAAPEAFMEERPGCHWEQPGDFVIQIHSDYKNGRLESCRALVHHGSYVHTVNGVDLMYPSEGYNFTSPLGKSTKLADIPVLETPVLFIDPEELDPDTKLPAHCTFTVGEGSPKPFLDNHTNGHKIYFVAERVMRDTRASWIHFTGLTMTEQLISTPNSGHVWLVQTEYLPTKETSVDGEERVDNAPDEPAIYDTPAPMSEPITSIVRSEAVTDWAQHIKHEVIDVSGDDFEHGG